MLKRLSIGMRRSVSGRVPSTTARILNATLASCGRGGGGGGPRGEVSTGARAPGPVAGWRRPSAAKIRLETGQTAHQEAAPRPQVQPARSVCGGCGRGSAQPRPGRRAAAHLQQRGVGALKAAAVAEDVVHPLLLLPQRRQLLLHRQAAVGEPRNQLRAGKRAAPRGLAAVPQRVQPQPLGWARGTRPRLERHGGAGAGLGSRWAGPGGANLGASRDPAHLMQVLRLDFDWLVHACDRLQPPQGAPSAAEVDRVPNQNPRSKGSNCWPAQTPSATAGSPCLSSGGERAGPQLSRLPPANFLAGGS